MRFGLSGVVQHLINHRLDVDARTEKNESCGHIALQVSVFLLLYCFTSTNVQRLTPACRALESGGTFVLLDEYKSTKSDTCMCNPVLHAARAHESGGNVASELCIEV